MKYLPRWSASVWALLVLLTGGAVVCLSPAWSADQKPLVINPTTGRTEQMQTGNNLLIPGGKGIIVGNGSQVAPAVSSGTLLLQANGTGTNPSVIFSDTVANVELLGGIFGGSPVWGSFTSHPIYFRTNNTDRLTIANTTGNATFSSTTDSTSKDTGSIVTEGGIGSEKAVTTGTNFIAGVAGGGLLIKEGSNAKMGAATLAAGTVTVNTTAVTANSRIYLTSQADGGTVGFQRISARTPGTDFTITSSSVLDTSTVAWMIVEPAP